jgi:hypothetical protein
MNHPIPIAPIPNTQRRVMRVAWGVALLFFGAAVLCGVVVPGEARYAGIVLSGFAGICGVVTALVYLPRAREFDRLFNREPPLVAWEYTSREWLDYVRENYQRDREGNWGLWILVAVICGVVGVILTLLSRDPLFLWITGGLAVFLILPALGVPKVRRWRMLHNPSVAIISRNAVWIAGRFQTWATLGAHLISVEIDPKATPQLLCITFRFYTRTGPQDETVRIPIPAGQDAAAESTLQQLRRAIHANP